MTNPSPYAEYFPGSLALLHQLRVHFLQHQAGNSTMGETISS